MIVVADAGPLIHLAAIGQLQLIRRLSPEVSPLLEARRASGLWLSDSLVHRVLAAVGESG